MTGQNIRLYAESYFVADSMRFMFANMNIPAMRQITMSTTQSDQSGSLIQRSPGTDTR